MPIIVQHSSKPLHNAASAKGIPLKIIHRIFAITDKVFPPYSTSLPKGKEARVASLKHCRPIGMPMIVILHRTPAIPHERPCHRPQHKNHIMFPKQPIYISSLQSENVPQYPCHFLYPLNGSSQNTNTGFIFHIPHPILKPAYKILCSTAAFPFHCTAVFPFVHLQVVYRIRDCHVPHPFCRGMNRCNARKGNQ